MSKARLKTRALSIAGVFLALAVAPAAPALASPLVGSSAAGSCRNLTGAPPARPGQIENVVNGVAVVSACSAWLVGEYVGPNFTPLAEHWNGASWVSKTVPYGGGVSHDNFLRAVAAQNSKEVWAVGDYDHGDPSFAHFTLVERWNGSAWFQVPSPDPGGNTNNNLLYAVTTVSARDAWAVGNFSNGTVNRDLILRWNGSSWKQVKAPNPAGPTHGDALLGVAATGPGNAWAVGAFSDGKADHTLALRWNGRKWQPTPTPDPGGCGLGDDLTSVAGTSSTDAWAVGYFTSCLTSRPTILIEHWNGTTWRRVKAPQLPRTSNLSSVTAISPSDAWAVGGKVNSTGHYQTLILHWNGSAWHQVSSADPAGSSDQNFLTGVAAWSANELWAVGNGSADDTDPIALHCC